MGLLFRPRGPLMRLAAGTAKATAADHGSTRDPTEELERLVRLHDTGSLNDEEFRAAKAKVLRS